jgi:hypothetical protein
MNVLLSVPVEMNPDGTPSTQTKNATAFAMAFNERVVAHENKRARNWALLYLFGVGVLLMHDHIPSLAKKAKDTILVVKEAISNAHNK